MTVARAAVAALALLASAGVAAAQTADAPLPKLRQICAADFQKLCPDVKPGHGAVAQCFKGHIDELSPDCKAGLLERRAAMKERRAEQMEKAAGMSSPDEGTPPPPK